MRKFVKKAALVLPFLALAARPSEAVLLRYKFQPGETLNYVVKLNATGQMMTPLQPAPQPISVWGTMLITYKVLTLNQDGSYTLRIVIDPKELKINVGGLPQEAQPTLRPIALKVVMTPLGEVKKIQVEGAQGQMPDAVIPGMAGGLDPSQFMPEIAGSLLFPEGDVQVGQVWTGRAKVASPLLQQPLQITTKSELVQLTTYMGRPCAVIDTTSEMPLNFSIPAFGVTSSGHYTGVYRTLFDYEAGRALQLKGELRTALTSQAQFQQPDGTKVSFNITFQMAGQVEATLSEGT